MSRALVLIVVGIWWPWINIFWLFPGSSHWYTGMSWLRSTLASLWIVAAAKCLKIGHLSPSAILRKMLNAWPNLLRATTSLRCQMKLHCLWVLQGLEPWHNLRSNRKNDNLPDSVLTFSSEHSLGWESHKISQGKNSFILWFLTSFSTELKTRSSGNTAWEPLFQDRFIPNVSAVYFWKL